MSPFAIVDHALLGGGTVLAARWQHRLSTDLDFFTTQDAFDNAVVRQSEDVEDALNDVAFGTIVTPNHMQCVMRDTSVEVSVSPASAIGPPDPFDKAEHGVSTQTTSAILLGKVAGRDNAPRASDGSRHPTIFAWPSVWTSTLCILLRGGCRHRRCSARLISWEQELADDQRWKPLLAPAHVDLADDVAGCGRAMLTRLGQWVESVHGRQRGRRGQRGQREERGASQ